MFQNRRRAAGATCTPKPRRSRSRNVWMKSSRHWRLSASDPARNERGKPPRHHNFRNSFAPTSSRSKAALDSGHQARAFDDFGHVCILSGTSSFCKDALRGALPLRRHYLARFEGRWLYSIARIKPGVTLGQAQAQMTAIASRLEAAYPDFNKNWTISVEPLRDSMIREVRASMLVLLGSVGLLL